MSRFCRHCGGTESLRKLADNSNLCEKEFQRLYAHLKISYLRTTGFMTSKEEWPDFENMAERYRIESVDSIATGLEVTPRRVRDVFRRCFRKLVVPYQAPKSALVCSTPEHPTRPTP